MGREGPGLDRRRLGVPARDDHKNRVHLDLGCLAEEFASKQQTHLIPWQQVDLRRILFVTERLACFLENFWRCVVNGGDHTLYVAA